MGSCSLSCLRQQDPQSPDDEVIVGLSMCVPGFEGQSKERGLDCLGKWENQRRYLNSDLATRRGVGGNRWQDPF